MFTRVPCAHKILGGPIAFLINGKNDDKYCRTKSRHAIILQENRNNLRKESIKKYNDKKPSHLEREIDSINQKRNNNDEGIGKRYRRGKGADLGLNIGSN
jgi:hypothetical protein